MGKHSPFDVIIIGGSYAGLAAAMALGRSRRSVLIIDSGLPCNRQTPHAHNLIAHDGDPPASILEKARAQVSVYPGIQFQQGQATGLDGINGAFSITTADGASYTTAKVLLTTGLKDIPLPISGFAECWGISVLHCPYCHGYEVTDRNLGLLANGDIGFEFSKLISNWSRSLRLFTNGPATLSAEQTALLSGHGILIDERTITAIEHSLGYMQGLIFEDGSGMPLDALFAKAVIQQHSDLASKAGCVLHTEGLATGLIQVDELGKTSVPGIYAAGDNTTAMRSLAAAIAGGTKAGAGINHELVGDRF